MNLNEARELLAAVADAQATCTLALKKLSDWIEREDMRQRGAPVIVDLTAQNDQPSSRDWLRSFALAWQKRKIGIFYAHSSDTRARDALSAMLGHMDPQVRERAWAQRDRMFDAFFASNPKRKIFSFFVSAFIELIELPSRALPIHVPPKRPE